MSPRAQLYARLLAIARRETAGADAEDVVQDALLIAIEAGRLDLADPHNAAWLRGVVRNRSRMMARSVRRRGGREALWQASQFRPEHGSQPGMPEILAGLPPSLRALAALVLTGHDRAEIAYLLGLPDTALRQRIVALKRHMVRRGIAAPTELSGLNLDLAYGRLRDALVPALRRHGGAFASHDPDGHLFIVRRSQNARSRQ